MNFEKTLLRRNLTLVPRLPKLEKTIKKSQTKMNFRL